MAKDKYKKNKKSRVIYGPPRIARQKLSEIKGAIVKSGVWIIKQPLDL